MFQAKFRRPSQLGAALTEIFLKSDRPLRQQSNATSKAAGAAMIRRTVPSAKSIWLAACSISCASAAYSDVRLPRLVGDNMVLQRDSKVAIWGWADPSEQVRIAFHGQEVTTRTNPHGRWSMSLGPFPSGGPYDMTIAGR